MRIEVRYHDDAVLYRHAKERDEAHAARDIEILSRKVQAKSVAQSRQRHHA